MPLSNNPDTGKTSRKIVIHYSTEGRKMFWWQLEDRFTPAGSKVVQVMLRFTSREFFSEKECRDNITLMKSIGKFMKVELYDGK